MKSTFDLTNLSLAVLEVLPSGGRVADYSVLSLSRAPLQMQLVSHHAIANIRLHKSIYFCVRKTILTFADFLVLL